MYLFVLRIENNFQTGSCNYSLTWYDKQQWLKECFGAIKQDPITRTTMLTKFQNDVRHYRRMASSRANKWFFLWKPTKSIALLDREIKYATIQYLTNPISD